MGNASAPSIPIATVPKNRSEEVRVSIDMFAGRRIFNSRVFYDPGDGKKKPGKAGLALRLDSLESYAEAVTSALMLARERGFIK